MFWLLLGWVLLPRQGSAQLTPPSPNFHRMTTLDGLLSNWVVALHTDRTGRIWIGTFEGLQMWNGHQFTTYRYKPGAKDESLCNELVNGIMEDFEGNIWVYSTRGGCNRLNPYTGEWTAFCIDKGSEIPPGMEYIYEMLCDQEGRIWAGTTEGLFQLQEDQFVQVEGIPSTMEMDVDRDGRIWTGNRTGIAIYDPRNGEIWNQEHHPGHWSLFEDYPAKAVSSMKFHSDGTIWIGHLKGTLTKFNPKTGKKTYFQIDEHCPLGGFNIISQLETKDKTVWVGASGCGLFHLSLELDLIDHFSESPPGESGLPNGHIGDLILDPHGFMTIASIKGLVWFDLEERGLSRLKTEAFPPPGPGIQAFCAFSIRPNGETWVGTGFGQVLILDRNLNLIREFQVPGFKQVVAITWVSEDKCWIRRRNSIHFYDLTKSESLPQYSYHHPDLNIYTEFAVNADSIWFATKRYISLLEKNKGIVKQIPVDVAPIDLQQIDQQLWAASPGVRVFDLHSDRFVEEYGAEQPEKHALLSDNVFHFLITEKYGYFGTTNHGLAILDRSTNTIRNFTVQDGLPGNNVEAFLVDHREMVWIETSKGVVIHQPGSASFVQVFSEGQLTPNYSLHLNFSGYLAEYDDHRIGLLTGQELIIWDNDSSQSASQGKLPMIEQIETVEGKHDPRLFTSGKEVLRLPYEQNSLRIQFSTPHVNPHSPIQYAYMLHPLEKNWVYNWTYTLANYHKIPSGEYEFRLRSSRADGSWGEEYLSFQVFVPTPWYKRSWVRIGVFFVLFFGLAGGFQARMWRIKKKREAQFQAQLKLNRLEMEKRELERKALTAQMDPHFISNALNSINRFILGKDEVQASRYLSRFSKLIRLILENSEKSLITLSTEIRILEYYLELEGLRLAGKMNWEIKMDEALDPEAVELPPMLIQPFVENAVWHGIAPLAAHSGKVTLSFDMEEDLLRCTIEDNGIGREMSLLNKGAPGKHTSMGMEVTEKRLAQLYRNDPEQDFLSIIDLYDDPHQPTGTKVIFRIPQD